MRLAKFPGKLVKFLGKVQFTIILLVVGMVVMTVGTIVESREGRDLAQVLIYRALWFDVFLFLIALNLVMAVVNRIPIRRRQWPIVFTHLALVSMLVGAWISHTFGYEGRMMIFEGGEESQIVLDTSEIRARWHREPDASTPGRHEPGPPQESSVPLGGQIDARQLQREAEGRPGLRVVDYVPRGVARQTLAETGSDGAPGIEFALLGPQVHIHEWLIADGRSPRRTRLGPIDVEFLVVRAEQSFEFLAAPAPAPTGSDAAATLSIQPKRGGDPVRIPLPASVGRDIAYDTGVVVRVEQFLPRARLVDGELVDVPTAGLNPAAIVVVEAGEHSERHTIFARFPDFGAIHGREKGEELVGELRLEASELDARALVTVILGPDGHLHVQLTPPGDARTEATALAVDKRMELGGLGVAFAVERFFERARPEIVVSPAPEGQEGGNPYIQIQASLGDRQESFWLGHDSSKVLNLGSYALEVAFTRQRRLLPFTIALEDFELIYHPGSRRPAEYRSVAQVKPAAANSEPRDVVISMNRPLDEAGFRLFQSSYRLGRGDRPDATILSVSYDPGVPVVYTSFALIVIGIAWYVQGQRRRLKFSSRATRNGTEVSDLEGPLPGSTAGTAQTAA